MPLTPEALSNPPATGQVTLQVRNLSTCFFTSRGTVRAVDNVSFHLNKGECLCLVGESGCGKTVTSLSLLRLFDSPPGQITSGEAWFGGRDLLRMSDEELRRIRGNRIAMVFQDPQSSLNPVLTVGFQIQEQLKTHLTLKRGEASEKAIALMKLVGIPDAAKRVADYPHQFSGGMKQRIMIAMALSCDPEIIIADEPTTALDVTIKAEVVKIFKGLKETRDLSLMFITHDFSVVAQIADRIIVMYAGKIVESGPAAEVLHSPKHPYTAGLINCLPDITREQARLAHIPGSPPNLTNPPPGCRFHPRCPRATDLCGRQEPGETAISEDHRVFCHLLE